MIHLFVIAPVSTAASGNTSWMLKTSGPRRTRWVTQPVRPIVSGGDMAITASTRPPRSDVNPASALKPTNPAARRARLRLSPPGNGLTRVIEPHSVRSRRTHLPSQPGSTAWSRYHGQRGDDVHLVAERGELVDDPGHHLTRRRGVGREVRAQHGDPQPVGRSRSLQRGSVHARPTPAPDAVAVNAAARRSPAAIIVARFSSHPIERIGPRLASKRQHETGAVDDRRDARRVAERSPDSRAPSPRSAARRTLRTGSGTPSPRPSSTARCGPRPRPCRRGGCADPLRQRSTRFGGTARPGEHQPQVGVGPSRRQQIDEEPVVLVRMCDGGIDDHRPVAEREALRATRPRR